MMYHYYDSKDRKLYEMLEHIELLDNSEMPVLQESPTIVRTAATTYCGI